MEQVRLQPRPQVAVLFIYLFCNIKFLTRSFKTLDGEATIAVAFAERCIVTNISTS
jgi:hypothetical protein